MTHIVTRAEITALQLAAVESSRWKGKHVSLPALSTAFPIGEDGWHATIDAGGGSLPRDALWDADTSAWVLGSDVAASTTDALPEGSSNLYHTTARAIAAVATVIGSSIQAYSAKLQAIATLTWAANKFIYLTGTNTVATADITAAGLALLDDADASAQRTTLGLAIGADIPAYGATVLTSTDQTIGGIKTFSSNALLSAGAVVDASYGVRWGSSGTGSPDTGLFREAANIIGQRNGANSQAYRLFSSYTDASNYACLVLKTDGMDTLYAGTGTPITELNLRIATVINMTVGSGYVRFPNGTTGVPAIAFANDTDTGFTRGTSPVANEFYATAGGTLSLKFAAQGAGLNTGSASSPGLFFTASTSTGAWYDSSSSQMRITSGGVNSVGFGSSKVQIPYTNYLAWSGTGGLGTSDELTLYRDAADVLAQRRTTTAQAYRLYNTYTNSSNYERLAVYWSSNVCRIRTENAGTGTARRLVLGAGGTDLAGFDTSGNWCPETASGYSLGTSSSPWKHIVNNGTETNNAWLDVVPTEGGTSTPAAGSHTLVVQPAGALTAATISLTNYANDGQEVEIVFGSNQITTITWSGGTFSGAPTTGTPTTPVKFRYRASNTTFYLAR